MFCFLFVIHYSYQIVREEKRFKIDSNSGKLFTTKTTLDREENESYEFQIEAKDNSRFGKLRSTCTVKVKVLDENDNAPEILNQETDFFIPPTVVEGDFIMGCSAKDLDIGRNGQLTYLLSGRDADMFDINPLNGIVIASTRFSQKLSYQIVVTASDGGRPSLASFKKFEIIMAKDLSVPHFDSFPNVLKVNEDAEINSVLATIRAVEGDVEFGVAGGNVLNAFGVRNDTGELFVNSPLDFEEVDYYELWVKVHFASKPLFFKATKVIIEINDINDNPPKFSQVLQRAHVAEEQFPPFKITEIRATDLDKGVNGKISYSLTDTNSMFQIDSTNGIITCNEKIDRETVDQFKIKVDATYNGSPAKLSSTSTVLLTVDDINDNAPLFSRLYSINVTENTKIGTRLITLETSDKDTEPNARVRYHLISGEDFQVDAITGEVKVAAELDREVKEEYELTVQVGFQYP